MHDSKAALLQESQIDITKHLEIKLGNTKLTEHTAGRMMEIDSRQEKTETMFTQKGNRGREEGNTAEV